MIVLDKFPLPPTVNRSYENRTVRRKNGRGFAISRRKSDVLSAFVAQCLRYRMANFSQVMQASAKMKEIINSGDFIDVECLFLIHRDKMLTKGVLRGRGPDKSLIGANQPKGTDGNNYVKGCIDGLVKITGIDDKWFLRGSFEKIPCEDEENECAIIRMTRHKLRAMRDLSNLDFLSSL